MITDCFKDEVQEYCDGVLSGSIVASQLVLAAVNRFQADLAKESTAAFPYHFDWQLARKCCRFYPSILRHSIGRHAGHPFELEPWQKFCTANIFGWLRDSDNSRRFRKSYRSMARKNGKSTWLAGESIFMAGFDNNPRTKTAEPVAQVVLSATKREQVDKVVFAEVQRMRNRSASVTNRSRFVKKEVKFHKNDGEIITTGSDKPYDGLNPHCVVMDELHAWREHHREFYDTMVTGSGQRDQPLINMITTAGDDRSYLWLEVYNYAKQVVSGTVQDDEYFVYVAELDEDDDPLDESTWLKSNPNLGVSVQLDYLQQQAREAATSAIALNRFTRYHGNRRVASIESAFELPKWDACRGELSDWSRADVVTAGFDLGGYDDLSAYALVARFVEQEGEKPVYRYECKIKAFISEETRRNLTEQPFATWIYQDLLKKTRLPNNELRASLTEDCWKYGIREVAFDVSNARSTAEELQQQGITCLGCSQSYVFFNEPIRQLLEAVEDGHFKHDGNHLLRWCASNAVVVKDRQDRWMYDKRSSRDKIDPIVALTMAFRLALLAPARPTGKLYIV